MLFTPNEEENNEVNVPKASFTQLEIYRALYKLCWNDNRFEGPGLELRTGRCSHDILFLGPKGEKIAYEIDGEAYHNWDDDKKRDYFLKLHFGWKVYRIKCSSIDAFGFTPIAEMIHCHMLKELGYDSGIVFPSVIQCTQPTNNRKLH